MHIVAAEALYPTRVHHALNEIIPLHAVLVSGSVREMRERRFPKPVLFQFPEIFQFAAHMKAHRPIVILAINRVL